MSLITYLTAIEFGENAIARLDDALKATGIARPLLVTDAGLVATGIADRVRQASARLADCPLYDGTPPNPTEAAVAEALALYRENGCDGVVALGGGSPIDLAKGVALLSSHDGPLADYAAIAGGVARIAATVAPVIAVPTTAGTGSEVGRAALITLSDGRKLGFISPHLIPRYAICDPTLTLGLPPMLTAATGFDAISHCVETFLSPRDNPPAEAIALDGLERAVGALEGAVADGGDTGARREMMMAALEGGLTFQKGLGAIHALSHPLGGLSQVPLHHGTLNAIFLPAVLRRNEAAAPRKYARMRQRLSLAPDADLAAFLTDLSARVGLPARLSEIGVTRALLAPVAAAARQDHSHATNPVDFSESVYLEILEEVF